jgi:hypothetical protein
MVDNLESMGRPMAALISATLYAGSKGNIVGLAAGFSAFIGITVVPAVQTRAKCNDIVGGVIPRP